jgi:hypothetical protein
VLDCSLIARDFDIHPPQWRDDLAAVVATMRSGSQRRDATGQRSSPVADPWNDLSGRRGRTDQS